MERYLEPYSISIGALLIVVAVSLLRCQPSRLAGRERPPGPRGFPFIGNTLQIPFTHFATYLKTLHSQYGGFVYLNINGEHVFSIGDIDLATELLDHRSAMYSSRPTVPLMARYADPEEFLFSLAKPGENHFWGRKLSTIIMKDVKAGRAEALQRLEAVALTNRLVDDGGADWYEQVSRMIARVTTAAMYGASSTNGDAPEVARVAELVDALAGISTPTQSIINFLPIIDDLIPSFVPTPWRTAAERWRKDDAEGWERLFCESVEKRPGMNTWASVFVRYEKDRRALLGTFASTRNVLRSFVLAAIAFPEWIEAAQKELDSVVGADRLPDFGDRASLPFIEAIVREVIRWSPAARMGVPHVNSVDDVIKYGEKEYFIPKGSTIFCSAYVMEYDTHRFESPEVFHPQRFLDEKGQLKTDYRTSSFGFGRRLCPGIPFAERTLWIGIAAILWTFNIRKTVDPSTGEPFQYSVSDDAFDGGLQSAPFPFPAKFEPRSKHSVAVVQREWDECEKDLNVLLPLQG